jgi:toxin ParE1/3/4
VNVRLTASTERDIAQAFEWYERQREDLGYRFIARVDEAIESIGENPKLYAEMIGEARRIFVDQFPYALWYKIGRTGVLIIGCLHHKRDVALARSRAVLETYQGNR